MRATTIAWTLTLALTCLSAIAQPAIPWPALATTGPGSITIAPASITYFARSGDTLQSIARQFTGKPKDWHQIGKINRIDRNNSIPIGAAIRIPATLLADDPSPASVIALSGIVTARRANGSVTVLTLGAQVAEGMQIETTRNGFVTLALADDSRVSLPSNSLVSVTRLRMARYTKSPRSEFLLHRGRVESRIISLEPTRGTFEIHTPLSVAGVRGTHFRVGVLGNSVTNEVLRGTVAVGKAGDLPALALSSAKGAIINTQGVGLAVNLLPAPRLVERAGAAYPAARFALVPVAGAASYHAQITTDGDALDVIAESRESAPVLTFDGIPDGHYFIRLSAIDRAGLQGLPHMEPIRIHARAALSPMVSDSNERDIFFQWQPSSAKQFVLQIARNADFSWLMYSAQTAVARARVPRFPFGTYYARVQSINDDGTVNPFSASQTFIVTDQWVINDGNAHDNRIGIGR